MKPRLARALLVVAVFALLTTVTVTEHYLVDQAVQAAKADQMAKAGQAAKAAPAPARPTSGAKNLGWVFWGTFRYYLAWTLVAPGVFWLGRVIPPVRRRWWRPLLFHLLIPVVAAIPFFTFRVVLSSAWTLSIPPFPLIVAQWQKVFFREVIQIAPTYWVLIGMGGVFSIMRADEARQVRTLDLQRALATAQLDGLRMKLQPDLLFNTLNSVGALAREGDTDGVAQLVDHLGTMLRLSMDMSSRQFVTLAEELQMLDEYLEIERVRYKDRLAVTRRIAQETGPMLVPNMIVQPLVRNAIAHGLGGRLDTTAIEIITRQDGASLEVSVRADGPGLPAGWTIQQGSGHGLATVQERLAALYGDTARLEVTDTVEGGVRATLRLPITRREPSDAGGQPWTA
jgi:two-component system, LytTR family, sensor kinase